MDGSKPPGVQTPAEPAHATNDQAAGVGVKSYTRFAAPYGHVAKGQKSDLFHYPYHGKNAAINDLVARHGYQTYYAGGKYGKPDLANKNYNTGHLMVYDPSPDSGASFGEAEYTDSWRKIHELAHALVYPELNKIYGEGRRIGKLGAHRTMREALRAVHWEWLAAHKQRELSREVGVEVPDETFHKELNTVMHDAAHRAVTGKFTEPSGEGFVPNAHKVPLDVALGMVRDHARNLGLTGMHDLIQKKSEENDVADEKTYDLSEVRGVLAKTVKERLADYAEFLTDLRKRELTKNMPIPSSTPGGDSMAMNELCKQCGSKHAPGGKHLEKAAKKPEEKPKHHGPQNIHGQTLPVDERGWPAGTQKWAKPAKKGEDFIDLKNANDKDKRNKVIGPKKGIKLPGMKKPVEIDAPGSGGDISKGKKLGKADLGMGPKSPSEKPAPAPKAGAPAVAAGTPKSPKATPSTGGVPTMKTGEMPTAAPAAGAPAPKGLGLPGSKPKLPTLPGMNVKAPLSPNAALPNQEDHFGHLKAAVASATAQPPKPNVK